MAKALFSQIVYFWLLLTQFRTCFSPTNWFSHLILFLIFFPVDMLFFFVLIKILRRGWGWFSFPCMYKYWLFKPRYVCQYALLFFHSGYLYLEFYPLVLLDRHFIRLRIHVVTLTFYYSNTVFIHFTII